MKRTLDVALAGGALIALTPVLLVVALLIWWQDGHSPFYVAPRVAKGGGTFSMVKFRSMRVNADRSGVDSTAADDRRITGIGSFLRKYKLDELMQFWNVFVGDMSFVGPRPQVRRDVDILTVVERRLLDVRPGITDLSSIVFSDEGEILRGSTDPDLDYNQLIRPWKSRLGLLYIDHQSLWLDVTLMWLTATAIVSRPKALAAIARLLHRLNADADLCRVARRDGRLVPTPPPGAVSVVAAR